MTADTKSTVRLAVALIVLATVAAYSNSLRGPFVFDDLGEIVGNLSIRRLWPLRDVLVDSSQGRGMVYSRPFVRLTLAANYALGGLDTFQYHLTNLFIHLLAGLTLFGIVRRTLELPALRRRYPQAATPLALAAALLWTLHPIQTAAVTYLTQRYESLMGLFFLLALYGVVRSVASPWRRTWETLAVAAVLLAMECKEVAVSLPLCILLYDRAFLAGTFSGAWARRRGMYLGLMAVCVVFAAHQLFFSAARGDWSGYGLPITWLEYARTQPGVILHYLRMSFWPHPLVLDYGWPVARTAATILPGAVVLGALAAASAGALVRRPTWGFLGASFFLVLAPSSSVMPLADLAFIHRMYLPLATVVVAVELGGYSLGEAIVRRGWLPARVAVAIGAGVVAAIAATLAIATWQRNLDYASAVSIWADNAAKLPGNARAQNNLGLALLDQGRTDEALARFQNALKINPDHPDAHNNVGFVLKRRGQTGEAIVHFQKALEANPRLASAHNNLGLALAGRGLLDQAIAHFRKALEFDPDSADAHFNLGILLVSLGQTQEGIAHYQRTVEIRPDSADAHNRLGIALAKSGQSEAAIIHFRKALQNNPDFAEAHVNLGSALLQLGRVDEARPHLQRSREAGQRPPP